MITDIVQIWKCRWSPIKITYIMCRYWVLTVVPYLLYVFCVNHSSQTCQRIYRIPVILAMWNQAGAEGKPHSTARSEWSLTRRDIAVLVIRTYAFFNRNGFVLLMLLVMMSAMISYQLWVAVQAMDRKGSFPSRSSMIS